MTKEFNIEVYRAGNDIMITLKGRLVLEHCTSAKSRLGGLIDDDVANVYVHLTHLEFLDSAGLGVFVSLKQIANRHRTQLSLLSPTPRVEEVFRVSKLDTIFDLCMGSQAEVIATKMGQETNLLWADNKEASQVQYNTEAHAPRNEAGNLTALPTNDASQEQSEASRKIEDLCNKAVALIKAGELEQAIEAYMRVLNLDADNMTALNNLGIVYEKRPQWYRRAHECWQRVLEISRAAEDQKHESRARKHIFALEKLID